MHVKLYRCACLPLLKSRLHTFSAQLCRMVDKVVSLKCLPFCVLSQLPRSVLTVSHATQLLQEAKVLTGGPSCTPIMTIAAHRTTKESWGRPLIANTLCLLSPASTIYTLTRRRPQTCNFKQQQLITRSPRQMLKARTFKALHA